MPRFLAVAVAAFLLALPTVAAGQTTALPADASGSCAEPSDSATAAPAATDGGGTPAPAATPVSDAGGGSVSSSDAGSDASTPAGGASSTRASSGARASKSSRRSGVPLATAAQEPEPEPEGPGEEQPEEPGGEPQPPTGDEQPDTGAGGGLPQTGFKALQLGLLGVVLLLAGARIRAIAKRRRRPDSGGPLENQGEEVELAPDGLPRSGSVVAYRESVEETEAEDDDFERHARDEWSFPDPDEPAPTGLLPSTAIAKRKARRDGDETEAD